tara:strand:- start:288 stop:512 length:225 start_codon:yes stop_codon:yes gene_type:complete
MGLIDKINKNTDIKDAKDEKTSVSLNIRDTDFILKLFNSSSFQGSDLETAYKVMEKMKYYHNKLMENVVEINNR